MSIRVMILGTGGVGGYFGARLAQGGCDVKFVARGKNLKALRESGLQVESQLGNVHLPKINVSDNPGELGDFDIVLICVKLWDTEEAARAVAPLVKPGTAVISLQNGVHKDDLLRGIVGEHAVVGGISQISARILRPGVISHTGVMQRLVFGEYDGAITPRLEAFLEACRRGRIDAEISSDIRRTIWEKFVFIVGVAAATASMRKTIGPICSNGKTRAFLLDLMRETVAVGQARGIRLDENYAEGRVAFCESLPFEMTSSMHTDLEQGNRLELEWLSGEVVRLGRELGVSTPLNGAVCDILELYATGK